MIINPLKLDGTYEITLEPICDNRGYFMRTYAEEIFKELNINQNWVHENQSLSKGLYIVRGLHFQFPPFTETKLVRVVKGKILDVFVDLRKNSNTFGQWDSIELSEENKKMVYIPRGFAHGFCTLSETTEVCYKVDNYYSKEHECGLLWNDKDLNIDWPSESPIMSEKDKHNLSLKQFINEFKYIDTEKTDK